MTDLDSARSNLPAVRTELITGWVATATVKRATDFIDARAGQPITIEEVASSAEVTVFALRYSFRQQLGTTPERYLRRIRLERARQALANAAGLSRRLGWASFSPSNLACLRRFGKPPRPPKRQ
jgi:transcriptional regulator GlxA family with amidase domain